MTDAAPDHGPPTPEPGWRALQPVADWLRLALAAFVVVGTASTVALLWLQAGASSPDSTVRRLETAQDAARALWVVQVVLMVAIGVLVVAWLRRLAANHVALARPGTRFATPGWATGAWLLWFVLPVLVVRELWKGSDPAVPEGSPAWRDVPTGPVIGAWFATFVVGVLVTNVTVDALSAGTLLEVDRLATLARWRSAATAALVVSAALLRRLARSLTTRQQAATHLAGS
jgi:hypothetical protein